MTCTGHQRLTRITIPAGCIRTVRVGPVAAPAGSMHVDGRDVAFADVRAGHFLWRGQWYFAAFDDPARTVVLDLDDFDVALRPYARVTIQVDDPEATRQAIVAAIGRANQEDGAPPDVAWTALAAGDAVLASTGERVGTVTHPLGDLAADVFEGVAFRASAAGIGARMAQASEIDRIMAGSVQLNIPPEAVRDLPLVVLEDLREVRPGRGIFHHPSWHRDDNWDGNRR